MIPEPVLRLAVERAIVSADQANALRALARAEAAREFEPTEDREKLRFISGFGDIFVVIGIALFMGASGYFAERTFGLAVALPVLAGLSWLLSELFARFRRMALPSIVLLVLFTVFGFLSVASWLNGIAGAVVRLSTVEKLVDKPSLLGLSALITVALAYVHYLRFRVPITVAAGAAALGLAFYAFLTAIMPGFVDLAGPWLYLMLGLAIFTLAMRYDRSDLRRETRRTDIAFWLHLLAAPVIVHSFVMAVFGHVAHVSLAQASGLLAVFGALAVLALLIDRRAILVSALIYAGVAFGTLFRQTMFADASLPATLLVLGAFILLLSAGWQPLRRIVLTLIPREWRENLPSPVSTSNT
jgi:hypothetical protein